MPQYQVVSNQEIADSELVISELASKNEQPPTKNEKSKSKCGTTAGHSAHNARGEKPCRECKDARNLYYRLRLERLSREDPERLAATQLSDQRRKAEVRALKKLSKDGELLDPTLLKDRRYTSRCGTSGGYTAHKRRQEEVCPSCLLAKADYSRALKDKKRTEDPERYRAERRAKEKKRNVANPEKQRARRLRKYRRDKLNNPEKLAAKSRRHRANNLEAMKAKNRAYKKANPEKSAECSRRRRAKRAGVDIDNHTTTDLLAVYGTLCYLCREEIDLKAPRRAGVPGWELGLQEDHVVPLYLGGSHTIGNVRPAHGVCNLRKSYMPLEVALQRMG